MPNKASGLTLIVVLFALSCSVSAPKQPDHPGPRVAPIPQNTGNQEGIQPPSPEGGSDSNVALGKSGDDIVVPLPPDLAPAGTVQPQSPSSDPEKEKPVTPSQPANPAPPAPPPSPPPPPPGPTPTHKVAVTCTNNMVIDFTFGGRTEKFSLSSPVVNGQPTELATSHCPKIKTALDQKSFPTGKTLSQPKGGTGLSTSCNGTSLSVSLVTGDPGNGTGTSQQTGVDIESSEVCLEIRNTVNALMLKNGP